jgi:hypothetical protein
MSLVESELPHWPAEMGRNGELEPIPVLAAD